MRAVSAQVAYLGLEGIEDDAILLPGGERRAVLEVGSVNFALQGEREREATILGFAAFLNGLTFPIQILVWILPVDVAAYLDELEHRARQLAGSLADLAYDHLAFVRRLARSRTLLERRFYVVVPARSEAMSRVWSWPFRARTNRLADEATARHQLTHRCAEVERQLGRCGLAARRLADEELAAILHECWCADQARTQRLGQPLADMTVLVVQASGTAA